MKSYLHFNQYNKEKLPEQFQKDDVRYADEFVRYCVTEFSKPRDIVLDPFAGFGTSLIIAEEMGRAPYGLEVDPERCKYVQSRLAKPTNLVCGDARQLSSYRFPMIDLCLTSPPYMNKFDHPEDPLSGYSTKGVGYDSYIREMERIYEQIAQLMKPAAHAVIEVSNLKTAGGVTPLAWDIAQAVSRVLKLEGETILCWDERTYGYDHSYCFVFSLLD